MLRAERGCQADPEAIRGPLTDFISRTQTEQGLVLSPLRVIIMTSEVGESVRWWQAGLGLQVSGVSSHPEGAAVGKVLSWGDSKTSARAVLILWDSIVGAVAAGASEAQPALAHELGHVHDDYFRGITLGFPANREGVDVRDLEGIYALLAQITWAEYAAESIAAPYAVQESLQQSVGSDLQHLEGIHGRLRAKVEGYRRGRIPLFDLWSESITYLSDLFANLGRLIARTSFLERSGALGIQLRPSGDVSGWATVIMTLGHELRTLRETAYRDWAEGAFRSLEQTVACGFETVGLFPHQEVEGVRLFVR